MAFRISILANPDVFRRFARPAIPIAGGIALACLVVGTLMAFFFAPQDARQGQSVRIMFVHVPAAWLALQTYALIAIASLVGFVWRHRVADLAARAAAPLGFIFTALALVTGSLWGKVTWGVYWDWDPRLTSMLVLLFLYAGYIALWQANENEATAARNAALLAMIGAVNLPIIKFSVDWWDGLHQKATVTLADGGPKMPTEMLIPLLIMALGYIAFSAWYVLLRTRTALDEKAMQSRLAEAAPAASTATMEPAE